MSDDLEERINDYWNHTYKKWDAADDAAARDRDHQITRRGIELDSLARKIDRSIPAAEVERARKWLDTARERMMKRMTSIRERVSSLEPSMYSAFSETTKKEWLGDLEKIDLTGAEADTHLAAFRKKVSFQREFVSAELRVSKSQTLSDAEKSKSLLGPLHDRSQQPMLLPAPSPKGRSSDIREKVALEIQRIQEKARLELEQERSAREAGLRSLEADIDILVGDRGVYASSQSLYNTLRSRS
jgi:hypothetical protein